VGNCGGLVAQSDLAALRTATPADILEEVRSPPHDEPRSTQREYAPALHHEC
jgi:hypothetical protein